MTTNRHLLYAALVLLLAAPSSAGSQDTTASKRPALEIALRTSRSLVPAGSGFGIIADITNKSKSQIFLIPRYLMMTPPIELNPEPVGYWATIQGVQKETDPKVQGDPDAFFKTIIRLGPGDKTTAFWAGGSKSSENFLSGILGTLRILYFAPGEYTIKVIALYWPDQKSAEDNANNYNSETAEIRVNLVAPQWVIIVGAILGGLIAYFLLPKARLRQRIDMFGIITAALLSLIVTVLISRISDTQFLVRVTVNDLWGAVAIGFIANASGIAILKRYVPSDQPTPGKTASDESAPPAEGTVPGKKEQS